MVWLVVVSCSQVLIFDTARQDTAREGGGGQGMLGVSGRECGLGRRERESIRGGGRSCMNGIGRMKWWYGGCGNLRSGEAKSGASED